MEFPSPEAGLVISFAYLWRHEHAEGQEEGRKNRPCVIVLAIEDDAGKTLVTVAPITHSQPTDATSGLEIPTRVKHHLGLDEDRSWVILNEVNRFTWLGYDLRPIARGTSKIDYGFLPPLLFDKIKAGILDRVLRSDRSVTSRD